MLRGMARKEFRSGPLFICDEQREEAIFFYFNPLALWALPLYSLTETQGERRVNSITSNSGIFNASPRRYAPQFSPIFSCENTGEKVGY